MVVMRVRCENHIDPNAQTGGKVVNRLLIPEERPPDIPEESHQKVVHESDSRTSAAEGSTTADSPVE